MDWRNANVSLESGVVKGEFPPLGTYILNRQPAKREIWLSSPVSGPHHFKYQNNRWLDRKGDDLLERLSQELTHHPNNRLSTRSNNQLNPQISSNPMKNTTDTLE